MSVVVFGGNGFVGQNILKALVARGESVVSISRSGAVPKNAQAEEWSRSVTWTQGDAMNLSTYADVLSKAKSVVVSVGSPPLPFVDESWQIKMNGESNATVINAAADAGVAQVVLINATVPAWGASGYVKGKKMAEECAEAFVKTSPEGVSRGAMVLKPGAVYGTRHTSSGFPIPLSPILAPVSWVLGMVPGVVAAATKAAPFFLEGALVPPVAVDKLATLAADGAVSPEYAGVYTSLSAFEVTK
mmetsp:Transcript_92147/g.183548  ORF Transcript_92147/g.183548 Transcript_92147/m.183548 type:complete len:245 (+) Transcript_92147:73-807(+)|eukprot:CAMPEP_0171595114 /NCGR_PEP_ID=MMETSP0990-20121206/1130_1 /TAXON_ID=483369 /ORGANISM="non described non described, Strain CCMP2098" /LENGTH=244 /DNA_ID=CAMNT_0012156009 /DNA_START=71 /DNA_END=805 /DNA_ORIENTATION=+